MRKETYRVQSLKKKYVMLQFIQIRKEKKKGLTLKCVNHSTTHLPELHVLTISFKLFILFIIINMIFVFIQLKRMSHQ